MKTQVTLSVPTGSNWIYYEHSCTSKLYVLKWTTWSSAYLIH